MSILGSIQFILSLSKLAALSQSKEPEVEGAALAKPHDFILFIYFYFISQVQLELFVWKIWLSAIKDLSNERLIMIEKPPEPRWMLLCECSCASVFMHINLFTKQF